MTKRGVLRATAAGLVLLVLAGCTPARTATPASDSTSTGAASGDAQVKISAFRFQPDTLEVKVGTKVMWTNEDAILHTVTSGTSTKKDDFGNYELKKNGTFDGTMDDKGKTFSYTFATAGEYSYFCSRHNNMVGKVVVK